MPSGTHPDDWESSYSGFRKGCTRFRGSPRPAGQTQTPVVSVSGNLAITKIPKASPSRRDHDRVVAASTGSRQVKDAACPPRTTSMLSTAKAPSQTADVCPRNSTLPGAINDSYAGESLSQKAFHRLVSPWLITRIRPLDGHVRHPGNHKAVTGQAEVAEPRIAARSISTRTRLRFRHVEPPSQSCSHAILVALAVIAAPPPPRCKVAVKHPEIAILHNGQRVSRNDVPATLSRRSTSESPRMRVGRDPGP